MPKGRLRTTLQQILALTLPVAGGGCGLDRSGYEPVPCPDTVDSLERLTLSEPADSMTLRQWDLEMFIDNGGPPPFSVLAQVGTPCVNATDPDACAAAIVALDTVVPREGIVLRSDVQDASPVHDLVVTRGDTVEVVQTRAELQTLLGPIDTPHDATWWAASSGHNVECGDGEATVGAVAEGHEVLVRRFVNICNPVELKRFQLLVGEGGDITDLASETLSYDPFICIGRRPAGLIDIDHANVCVDVDANADRALGAFWAGIAHLEAASIHAFAALCRELVHHDAPRSLVQRAQRALRDEVRHARLTGDMARRHGATPQTPTVHKQPVRSLLAMALENATEGCVRETFGALIGLWQGQRAQDPRTRAVMQRVADDEVQHAELAWAVHRWLWQRLAPTERQQVQEAQQQALAGLSHVAASGPGPACNAVVGWPCAADAAALVQHFARTFQPA